MNYFQSIFIVDKAAILVAIDILIVSFFIYKFYMLLHKTRGMQLLAGIGVLLVIGGLAEYFELELLDWIITNIRPALVFAVIVLLQPELRRITSDLSRFGILNYFVYKSVYEIDEIINAVKAMARTKTGSIIVITKDISLKNIIEQSVQIDAVITSQLLMTIFKKNSPLHDGAVIIEQNRIASASSYLPMSNALETSTLGARHRSALGISEDTDAVVIVTSEETGRISICYEGEMIYPVKPFELRVTLKKLLENKDKKNEAKSAEGVQV